MPQSSSPHSAKSIPVSKSLDSSVADGAAFSVMAGLGDSYVPPFAVALGATNAQIGLLTALPYALSSLVQALVSLLPGIGNNRRLFVVLTSFLHGLLWLAMASLALLVFPEDMPVWALIMAFSLYFALNASANPSWASWMADLVPEHQRGAYFGRRNYVAGFALLVSSVLGGYLLGVLQAGLAIKAFAVLFGLAFVARMVSVVFLWKMADVPQESAHRTVSLKDFLVSPGWSHARNFSFFVALTSFATEIASPFFVVYMLRDLHMDYFTFAALLGIASLVKLLSMPYWGRLTDLVGNRNVLRVSGLLVPVVPVLWVFSADPVYLAAIQAFSGFVWAGFEISTFNYALSSTQREYRVSFISHYNSLNNLAIFIGALAGGLLAELLSGASFLWMHGLLLLFLLSGLARLAVSSVFLPLVEERKLAFKFDEHDFFWKAVAVYPMAGIVNEVYNGWNFTSGSVSRGISHGARLLDTSRKIGMNLGTGMSQSFMRSGGKLRSRKFKNPQTSAPDKYL